MFHGWQHLRPEDRENILRGIADGAVYGGPYHLELDWVDKCNARCFFCNSQAIHSGLSIPWERARRHVEDAVAGGLRCVRLCGGGEPMLHPNFPDLLELLGRHEIVLDNLNTNGTQLTERAVEALMGLRVSEVRVSLNYPTADTYSEGMGLPAHFFERVVRQSRRLSEARRGNPAFGRLVLQYFIYKPTMGRIRESYQLAREIGADVVVYRELWNLDPALCFAPEDVEAIAEQMRAIIREDWHAGIVVSHLESHGIGERIGQIYEDLRAELGAAPPVTPEVFDERTRYCMIGWYSMTVIGDQAVYPCCYLLPNTELPPLVNLAKVSLAEAWRGPEYSQFRKEMRDYMLLERRVPFFEKRARRIGPTCASHTGCPITRSMCDEAFYEEAGRRLEAVRRSPDTQAWRFINRAGRVLERKILGKKNW